MKNLLCSMGILVLGWSPAWSCFTPVLPGVNRTGVEYVRIVVDPSAANLVSGGATSVINGFHKWNQAPCQNQQPVGWVEPFPVFSSSLGTGTVLIRREDLFSSQFPGPDGGPASDSCASIALIPGTQNAIIRLFSKIKNPQGSIFNCNWDSSERTSLLVAHELGHYLGLKESSCHGSIMGGWQISWNTTNMMATFLGAGHAIRSYECEKADEISISPSESDYEEQQCLLDPSCDPYAPCWSSPGCTCPILLDLDHDWFHLASTSDPVHFDIDADGVDEQITWTSSGALDAFLCWDRNGNGKIDDGTELFGNSTPLVNGTIAPFGYIALSELDARNFGGNANGQIDPADEVFSQLCGWLDLNHDGLSSEGELYSLDQLGILEIGVDWITEPKQDEAGNLFLYHGLARVLADGRERWIRTTDVYFVEAPGSRQD